MDQVGETALSAFAVGAAIGFVAGVTPGPVLTLVIAETLRGGWARGAAVAAGPLVADGPIILLAVLLVAQLPSSVIQGLSLVGGGLLLYMAGSLIWTARTAGPLARNQVVARRGLVSGWLARALTPNAYLFWFLVGAPLLVQMSQQHWLSAPAFLVGYYSTIVGSNVVLALVFHRWVNLISDNVYRGLLLGAGGVLAAYGAGMIGRGLRTHG